MQSKRTAAVDELLRKLQEFSYPVLKEEVDYCIRLALYTPIDSNGGGIRLLELQPGLHEDILVIRIIASNISYSSVQSYEALSYAWGTDLASDKAHIWNGNKNGWISVTSNLDIALRHLRLRHAVRTLWIDALSIRQEDFRERNDQVQLMGKIYSHASKVVVWLGSVDPADSNLKIMLGAWQFHFSTGPLSIGLFEYVCSIIAVMNEQLGSSADPRTCALNTLYEIVSRPWFYRVWVVQELTLSKKAQVYIGSFSFPWEPFEQFFMWLPYYKVDSLRHHRLVKAATQIVKIPRDKHLASQLYRTLHLSATNPRDKVFGILGISYLSESILLADYSKSVEEVFTDVTASLLKERRFSIYCFAPLHPPKRDVELEPLPRLPSWVPDLRIASAVYHKTTTDVNTTGTWNHHNPLTLLDEHVKFVFGGEGSQSVTNAHSYIARPLADGTLNVLGKPLGRITATSSNFLDDVDVADIDVVPSPNVQKLFQDIAKPDGIEAVQFIRTLIAKDSGGPLHLEDLEGLAHDLFDTTRNRDEPPWSLRKEMKELDAEIRLHASNRVFFITDTGATGLSYHPDSLNGIRIGDEVASLFTPSNLLPGIPFVLRHIDGAGHYRMINVASFEPRLTSSDQDTSCGGGLHQIRKESNHRSYAII